MDVIPFVVLLIIPTLGAMSDHSQQVRLLAAQCFATLISLMPLEVGHLYIFVPYLQHIAWIPTIVPSYIKPRLHRDNADKKRILLLCLHYDEVYFWELFSFFSPRRKKSSFLKLFVKSEMRKGIFSNNYLVNQNWTILSFPFQSRLN